MITTAQAIQGMHTWSDQQINAALNGEEVYREYPISGYTFDPKVVAMIPRQAMLDVLHERAAYAEDVAGEILAGHSNDQLAEVAHTSTVALVRATARRALAMRGLHAACVTWESVRTYRAASGNIGVQVTGVSAGAVSALMMAGFRSVTFDKTNRTATALNLRDVSA